MSGVSVIADVMRLHLLPSRGKGKIARFASAFLRRPAGGAHLPNELNGSTLNEVSEFVCFRLQQDKALEKVGKYVFGPEELKAQPDLQFVARNLDSGGELRGPIKAWIEPVG
jgi:hypothetical protein